VRNSSDMAMWLSEFKAELNALGDVDAAAAYASSVANALRELGYVGALGGVSALAAGGQGVGSGDGCPCP